MLKTALRSALLVATFAAPAMSFAQGPCAPAPGLPSGHFGPCAPAPGLPSGHFGPCAPAPGLPSGK